jgi:cell division protein FtsB
MWQRRFKQKITSIISSPKTFFLVILLVLILLAIPLYRNLRERYGINQQVSDLQAQIGKTQNKNLELQKLIDYLGSDQYVEEQARQNLGLKKDGEQVYVLKGLPSTDKPVVGDNSAYLVPGLEKAQARALVSNPTRWVEYFFKH